MELFRQEYELNLPPNYGERVFKRMLNREKEGKVHKEFTARVNVVLHNYKKAFQKHIFSHDERFEIDFSAMIREFSEEEMYDVIENVPVPNCITIQRWETISLNVLRHMSILFGDKVVEIDLSYSGVTAIHLEVLLANVTDLRALKIKGCNKIDSVCMAIIGSVAKSKLVELYADDCILFKTEPILAIAGCYGMKGPKLSGLVVLSLAKSPVEDRGLIALGTHCCKRLKVVNLCDCMNVGDRGVCGLLSGNPDMDVINVSNCKKLTDAVPIALGRYCKAITAVNFSRCDKMTDKGLTAMLTNCLMVEQLNVSGLTELSEVTLGVIAEHSAELRIFNITGCLDITANGLAALITGIGCVTFATEYYGFKPSDNYLETRLKNKLLGIRDDKASLIQRSFRYHKFKRMVKDEFRMDLLNKYAVKIQRRIRIYFKRLHFYNMWKNRGRNNSILLVQRVYRGFIGRCITFNLMLERADFRRKQPFAVKMQKIIRGHRCRKRDLKVAPAIRILYNNRKNEALNSIAVRFQASGRRFLALIRIKALKEIRVSRDIDESNALLTLQCWSRTIAAKKVVNTRIEARRLHELLIYRSANRIKKWMYEWTIAIKDRLTDAEKARIYKREWDATMLLQKSFRGFIGRELFNKVRIKRAKENYAAIQIQRIYRGAMTLGWRDLRLNSICAYVLDRHYVERQDSLAITRSRYRMFLKEVTQDSASEPDIEEEPPRPWVEMYDIARQKPYWYDPGTGEITFNEPKIALALEKSLLYKRIRVFWVVQGTWYEGSITNYHIRKMRHRIQYDDGDHEWLNLAAEYDRVQVQLEDGTWVMYGMYRPPEYYGEIAKTIKSREDAEYKKQAFADAHQWKIIPSDDGLSIMFMSEKTGELRTGVLDAAAWIIQDDGYGFPCFCNTETGEIVYEDPRFVSTESEDLAQQRVFVLNNLRFCMYFVRESYDYYLEMKEKGNQTQINFALQKIRTNPKCKQMNAFLIRAKALFKVTSVVDQASYEDEKAEIEYSSWLSEQVAILADEANWNDIGNRDKKREMVAKFRKAAAEPLYCASCKRETKRHLDFCPHCGKKQIL